MVDDKLPEAELDVLACLQRRGEATAKEIGEALRPYRPMAHGSVVTLLKRLEAKLLVSKRKADTGKAFVYRPTRGAMATNQSLLKRIRQRVFGGDSVALVASLYESKPPTARELAELEQLLDRLRKETTRKQRGST
jgi:predicted transcriptional regulator